MRIAGSSMAPFLVHERDSISFCKPYRKLKTGDMVFYERGNGQFVMHRICGIGPDGYSIVGDAQTVIERSVSPDCIFALIISVKRKGKWIGPGNFWWFFFSKVWIRLIPMRPLLLRCYGMGQKLFSSCKRS